MGDADAPRELSSGQQSLGVLAVVAVACSLYVGCNRVSAAPPSKAEAAARSAAYDVQARVQQWCNGNGYAVSPADPESPGWLVVRVPREVKPYEGRIIAGKCYDAARYKAACIIVQDGSGMQVAECSELGVR